MLFYLGAASVVMAVMALLGYAQATTDFHRKGTVRSFRSVGSTIAVLAGVLVPVGLIVADDMIWFLLQVLVFAATLLLSMALRGQALLQRASPDPSPAGQ